MANKSLHWIFTPLRFVKTSEFKRWAYEEVKLENMEKYIVSKKRVADHGEVYTRKREVNAMLDPVKQKTEISR